MADAIFAPSFLMSCHVDHGIKNFATCGGRNWKYIFHIAYINYIKYYYIKY